MQLSDMDKWLVEVSKAQSLTLAQAKVWLILALSDPHGWGSKYRQFPIELATDLRGRGSMSLDYFADIIGDYVRNHTNEDGSAK